MHGTHHNYGSNRTTATVQDACTLSHRQTSVQAMRRTMIPVGSWPDGFYQFQITQPTDLTHLALTSTVRSRNKTDLMHVTSSSASYCDNCLAWNKIYLFKFYPYLYEMGQSVQCLLCRQGQLRGKGQRTNWPHQSPLRSFKTEVHVTDWLTFCPACCFKRKC